MRRIIVPLDGSSRAEEALPVAASLARTLDAPIELLQVLPGRGSRHEDDESLARLYLDSIAQDLPADLGRVTTVSQGDPARQLLALATSSEPEPDAVIVMGTHGRGGLGRAVIGSVADTVARAAAVPVTLVRESSRPGDSLPLRRLLVPLDGSTLAEQALPVALELAGASGATIHLLRVVEPYCRSLAATIGAAAAYLPPSDDAEIDMEHIDEARAYLDHIAQVQRRQGARVAWEVRTGQVAPEIVRAASTIGADLVVVSSHGRSGLPRLALGSVTDALVRTAPVPVMVVPRAAATRPAVAPSEREPVAAQATAAAAR